MINCDVKIGNVGMTHCVQEDIIRLNVTVDDFLLVEIGEATGNLCKVEFDSFFWNNLQPIQVDYTIMSDFAALTAQTEEPDWNEGSHVHRRSPPSIRSRTKKQLSSSWKA